MVAVLFDLDVISTRVEIEGVVGGGRQFAIDIDFTRCGVRVGGEETSPLDCERFGGAITLSIADHEEGATKNKNGGGQKDE